MSVCPLGHYDLPVSAVTWPSTSRDPYAGNCYNRLDDTQTIMSHHAILVNSRHFTTKYCLTRILGNLVLTYPRRSRSDALPGPLWIPMSVRVIEGIFFTLRFFQSHSEIFDFSLPAVEAEKLHFNNHPVILRQTVQNHTSRSGTWDCQLHEGREYLPPSPSCSSAYRVLWFTVLNEWRICKSKSTSELPFPQGLHHMCWNNVLFRHGSAPGY